ncbi:MAG TPA: ATP-binding protein, partial [Polyangiaceae bacterium]|nr:ATP-binding protein [Polyangiaceae bacterium]
MAAPPNESEADVAPPSRVIPELPPDSYRLALESVLDYAIYMLDLAGNVATWSSGARNIKGYTADEIVGRHFSRFFTPEDLEAGRPARELQTAAAEGRFEEEGWRVRKDGSRFWANIVLTPLRDADAAVIGFVKVTRDLTARRAAEQIAHELIREQTARAVAQQAEAQLLQERERYKALSRRLELILEGVAEGITVQDRTGQVTFGNTAAARMCGFESRQAFLSATPREIVSRFDLLDEEGRPFPLEALPGRRVLAGADSAVATMRVRERASQREWWSSVHATGVLDAAGNVELAINIWHDVSAERQREERERYVARATATLSASLDYESRLSALAALLVPGLADWCSIHLLEGDELKNVAVAHVDPAKVALAQEYQQRYPPDPRRPYGVWNVLRSGASELYETISDELLARGADDPVHLQFLRDVGMKSVLLAPIRIGERVTGTLSLIAAESGRRYAQDDVTLAEELGRRAGVAIENAKLYAAERKTRAQLELLARAGEAFSGAFEYQETLLKVVEITLPSLGDFTFFDVAEGAGVRRVAAAHEDDEVDQLIKQTSWVRSERQDKNLCALSSGTSGFHPRIDDAWMQDVASSPEHLELLRRLQLRSMLTVPLRARGEVLGSLTLCFGKSGRHHTTEDLSLAEELARRAALALVQVRLYASAQSAAQQAAEAAQRAEEANRIKDEFLATVSHELRTPLNAIVGWSSLLRARSNDPAISKGIDVIYRNAQAQGKLIEDILDVSRIITGKLRLDLKPADLVIIVRDAIEVVRPSAAAKRITLVFTPATSACLGVVDPERLQQVVWNLLSNAVKFTEPDGSISVSLRHESSSVVICVSDTGKGIEPDFLPYVFDRFKQADSSTTRRFGGLGLGLSIVRHIAELHGGHARAASAGLGKGASFEVVLPVRAMVPLAEKVARTLSLRPDAQERAPGASLAALRVLVVDDEPDARDLLQTVLQ